MRALVDRLGHRMAHLWVAAAVVLLDQTTKPLVRAKLSLHESITVVPGFVNLTHVQNTGAAFGILNQADLPYKTALLIGLAVVALIGIAIYAMRVPSEQHLVRVGLALVLGGAVGNLIDRVRTGYVLDFVDVYWRDYHFWAFNVADSAITVGVALIILDLILEARGAARATPGRDRL